MFQDIKKNKFKSLIIVSLFILMITIIIYYICMYFELGYMSIVIAMIFSIGTTFASYYYSDKIILTLNNARPATEEENQKLVNILDALMVTADLKYKPKLYIIDDKQLNAFATGRNPQHSVICVTSALLDKLSYYELEGVVAHELSHIKNYDILLSSIVTVMVGFIVILSDFFSRMIFFGRRRDDDNNSGNPILMLIGLIFLILSPIFGKLMQLALSRKREFLADATAVELTRNPDGLISALEKISSDTNELKYANTATENMYIANPFKGKKKGKSFANLFSTHPPIEDRIAALRNIR